MVASQGASSKHVALMLARELARLSHSALSINTHNQLALASESLITSALGVGTIPHVLAIAEHLLVNDPRLSNFDGIYDVDDSSSTLWSEIVFVAPNLQHRIPIRVRGETDPMQVDVVSRGFDFGATWFGYPCTATFLEESDGVFNVLEDIQFQRHRGVSKSRRWRDSLAQLMNAFAAEISRILSKDNEHSAFAVAKHMLGDEGRYDVLLSPKSSQIVSHNVDGRLKWGRRLKMPSRVIEVSRDNADAPSFNIVFDQSWQIRYQPFLWDKVNSPTLRMGISLVGRPAARSEYHISRQHPTTALALAASYPTISIV